jgi:hypothetical protein
MASSFKELRAASGTLGHQALKSRLNNEPNDSRLPQQKSTQKTPTRTPKPFGGYEDDRHYWNSVLKRFGHRVINPEEPTDTEQEDLEALRASRSASTRRRSRRS